MVFLVWFSFNDGYVFVGCYVEVNFYIVKILSVVCVFEWNVVFKKLIFILNIWFKLEWKKENIKFLNNFYVFYW